MDFRPWMIEAASDYIRASRILVGEHLAWPAWINAAIGLEILLKSFLADVDGPAGGIGEQYVFDGKANGIKGHGHDLLHLFDAISADVKARLNLDQYRFWIHDYFRQPFVDKRYPYERRATMGCSSVLTDISEEMLGIVIRAYKAEGCDDPWVKEYPNVYRPIRR